MGPCYTMVITAPSLLMAPIHKRMPALLRPEEMLEFLAGTGHWDFQPFSGRLADKKQGAFESHVDWIRTYGGEDIPASEAH